MKNESTISKINSELIRSFASLDAWFDKTLNDSAGDNEWSPLNVIRHLITSNSNLLDFLSDGYAYAFSAFDNSRDSEEQKSLDNMRFALREQLFHCLCLLDELEQENAADSGDDKEMNVYDKLSSLINHLHYHLEELENMTESHLAR